MFSQQLSQHETQALTSVSLSSTASPESQETTPLMDTANQTEAPPLHQRSDDLIPVGYMAIAMFNGMLYFAIAIKGGIDVQKFLHMGEDDASSAVLGLSAGNSVVYTMFTYKTLENLSLKIDSKPKVFFSLLSPFAASAFLTAGIAGAKVLHLGEELALSIGLMLFALRMGNCIDASVKFPQRFLDTKQAWSEAIETKDYSEIVRLLIVWSASIGYAACSTDAIYNSTQTITTWFNLNESSMPALCYTTAMLGALGTLPLTVYWSHRGLRQLTFGGKSQGQKPTIDPTDGYTYFALLCVFPAILGIMGGATASTGKVTGQLGLVADIIRISTSILYACFAGVPGMATLLRSAGSQMNTNVQKGCWARLFSRGDAHTPLLKKAEKSDYQAVAVEEGLTR